MRKTLIIFCLISVTLIFGQVPSTMYKYEFKRKSHSWSPDSTRIIDSLEVIESSPGKESFAGCSDERGKIGAVQNENMRALQEKLMIISISTAELLFLFEPLQFATE